MPTLALTLALALLCGEAFAQDGPTVVDPPAEVPPAEVPAARQGPALPELEWAVPAVYPEQALANKLEGEVLIDLDITAEGEVYNAEVTTPAGHGFDAAALQAVQSFRFRPALDDDGRAVESHIQYLYRFTLDMVPTVAVEGRLLAAGTRQPVDHGSIVLDGPDGAIVRAVSGADGRFRLADLAPGTWEVTATAPGYSLETVEITIEEGNAAEAVLYLTNDRPWEAGAAGEEIEVVGYRLTPEVTERRLEASELRLIAGTNGDIVRAVQNMPGVARTPFNAGQLMVRGTAPQDSGFFFGGVRIPIVYHFGGWSTVVNGDSLEQVLFLPGGYGVRYGRSLGGVVDLLPRPTPPQRSHGYLSVDVFQAAAFHDQILRGGSTLTLSGRRSYIDTLLNPVVNLDDDYEVRLPRYADLQARLLQFGERGGSMDMLLLVSGDKFTYSERGSSGELEESAVETTFQKLWLQDRLVLPGAWTLETTVIAGPEATRAEYSSDAEAVEEAMRLAARVELNRPIPDGGFSGWRLGIDVQSSDESFLYDMSELDSFFDYGAVEEGSAAVLQPGLYLEQSQRGGPVVGTPGVRVDYMFTSDGYAAMSVDPRFRIRWEVDDRTVLRGSIGRYSQFPMLREVADNDIGNPDLLAAWAVQDTLGLDRKLTPVLSLETTAYHSELRDLVVGRENRFVFALAPPPQPPFDDGEYDNDGEGRIVGLETLLRLDGRRTWGWVGATLSRSTRVDRTTDERELFAYDQPLVLTAVASRQLPAGWLLGLRARYGSGNPYTPVANHIYSLDDHQWVPIYDDRGISRIPGYWAIDLRADKQWTFEKWRFTTYLDVQNLTNRKNIELMNWSYDWTEEIPVYGLPIVPALGFKGEW